MTEKWETKLLTCCIPIIRANLDYLENVIYNNIINLYKHLNIVII
jgi:hypothetical protein